MNWFERNLYRKVFGKKIIVSKSKVQYLNCIEKVYVNQDMMTYNDAI